MIDRTAIYDDIAHDPEYRRLWRRRRLRWVDSADREERNVGLFRRRAIDAACDMIDAGERDQDVIVDSVCGSFLGSLIIGMVTRLLINAIVAFILKRLQESEGQA